MKKELEAEKMNVEKELANTIVSNNEIKEKLEAEKMTNLEKYVSDSIESNNKFADLSFELAEAVLQHKQVKDDYMQVLQRHEVARCKIWVLVLNDKVKMRCQGLGYFIFVRSINLG